MGKIIDAEFGGRNAGDRYCASCGERFPRSSALCPRCGGALTLWATHVAAHRQSGKRKRRYQATAALVLLAILIVVTFIAEH